MKYLLLAFLFIALKCNTSKTKIKENTTKESKVIVTEESDINTQEKLILTLKNPKKVNEAKALIVNSGLIWDELVIDKNSLKVATIKIPSEKKEFWISKLKTSDVFSSIQISSKTAIENIKSNFENSYVSIRKSKCSGDCPVYNLVVFKNGTAIFEGIKNVKYTGAKELQLTMTQLRNVKRKFNKTTFGTYFASYADKALMDFPSTFITHKDKEIEIKLWKNVPEELALAYDAIENILYEKGLIE